MMKDNTKGFSLVETVMIIAIFSMITLAFAGATAFFYKTNTYSVEQATAVGNGRKGVSRMVADIRESTYSDEGSYPVVAMATSSFEFYSDVDLDNKIEKIRYYYDEGNLMRGQVEAAGSPPSYAGQPETTQVIAEYIRNIEDGVDLFEYYDRDGNLIADFLDVSEVVFVRVKLVVNVNPTRLPNEFTIQSSATLRNVKEAI